MTVTDRARERGASCASARRLATMPGGRSRIIRHFTHFLVAASLTVSPLYPASAAVVQAPDSPDAGTQDSAHSDVGWGAELAVPFFSVSLPGLGQYVRGAGWVGVGYTSVAIAGVWAGTTGNADLASTPRRPRDQFASEAVHLSFTAGALSAWDAFHRAVPTLQSQGKYEFLEARESLGDLLTAPIDVDFLRRWTTWVNLGLSATVATVVYTQRNRGVDHMPFEGHDAAYVGSLSYNAAVGEEALFRGWLLPVFQQKLGGSFWAGNTLQASLFGVAHAPRADWFAAVIGLSGLYDGWLTRRNRGSVREAIFGHFWYDVFVGTATMLRDPRATVYLPTITIRF